MPIKVLDDFVSDAKEVHNHNRWMKYNLPLHRCRKMGYYNPVFDLLDERKMTNNELCDLFQLVLGNGVFNDVPDPDAN